MSPYGGKWKLSQVLKRKSSVSDLQVYVLTVIARGLMFVLF